MAWLSAYAVAVLSLVLVVALRPRVLRWWYVQQAGYYAARMTFVAGFGTAWLLAISNRLVTELVSAKASREMSRKCWMSMVHGEMCGHEIHRLVLHTLRELLQQMAFPSEAVNRFVAAVVRESIRREERRLYCWAEVDVTVRILRELSDDTRHGLREQATAQEG